MSKEQLNWRCYADQGAIARKWNNPATPAFYILDHHGIIRHKWIGHPGETAIDAALNNQINKALKEDHKNESER